MLVAAWALVDPGEVLVHARGPGEVGPGEVGDDATLDGELAEHVAPSGEESLLLGSGFDHELRAGDRDDRGEGVPLPVTDGPEAGGRPASRCR
ncbi:MAG: hypothetical protein V9E99_05315 [Microthrixaceae bacterium]